ncbi:MAG: glucose 1-dehydrogenase [Burkholderiales bacterium]|nr:glucose 1-dehydrogenase [Burkholderiales bacterium]
MDLNQRLKDRVVIVTGGASGIGAACARRYAAEGARVVIGDLDADGAAAVAGPIGGIAMRCDHTDAAQCQALVALALQHFGAVDVLHNNAGTGWTGRFGDMPGEAARRLLEVGVMGPILMTQAALPALRRSAVPSGGALLFTASGLGLHGRPMIAAYAAAKHAVLGLMRSLALELGPEGLRVNAVCPGIVDTPLVRATTGGWGPTEQVLENFRLGTPLRRLVQAEDVAASAAFLISDDARNLTGTALLVDGGAHEA